MACEGHKQRCKSDTLAHRRAEAFRDTLAGHGFDAVLDGMTLCCATPGFVLFRLRATSSLCNRYGTLHGGAIGAQHCRSRCQAVGANAPCAPMKPARTDSLPVPGAAPLSCIARPSRHPCGRRWVNRSHHRLRPQRRQP